jgi:hypothetical protein
MKLGMMDRLIALELLPKESDWAGIKEIRTAKETLSLTAEEIEKFEVKQDGGMIGWNQAGQAYIVDLPLSQWATTQIQEALRKKSHDKKLTERDARAYEIFVANYDQV